MTNKITSDFGGYKMIPSIREISSLLTCYNEYHSTEHYILNKDLTSSDLDKIISDFNKNSDINYQLVKGVGRPKGSPSTKYKLDKHFPYIVDELNAGKSKSKIAKELKVHPQTLYDYIKRKEIGKYIYEVI